jgi:hypothetical protein
LKLFQILSSLLFLLERNKGKIKFGLGLKINTKVFKQFIEKWVPNQESPQDLFWKQLFSPPPLYIHFGMSLSIFFFFSNEKLINFNLFFTLIANLRSVWVEKFILFSEQYFQISIALDQSNHFFF